MSDDLVKRLRGNIFGTGTTMAASDRIEALTAERDTAREYAAEVRKREMAAENARVTATDKLAKAVDTLMFYGGVMPNAFLPIQDGGEKARATLAEIEGEK
jgi:hypothetical protein